MTTDPRDIGGGIAGPGGPNDPRGVIIDPRGALIVDALTVCAQDDAPEPTVAAMISGRINKTADRADLLLLLSADAVAALLSELQALVTRADKHDPALGQAVRLCFEERVRNLRATGALGEGGG